MKLCNIFYKHNTRTKKDTQLDIFL